ncbi:hypothetical protein OO013_16615 [Mangrovivirga sp. M17]|uniref:Uncharacterized protein n=1 Tax=Mangrovivirga halotolerans TaxID=2993936 RepID=A0ABT3RUQ7_9BACT|nr:hypothetical protein [Mangrovivirga halotolerans]MCX2745505.1 hypothetical protein [Mangrovivirga halotolerans]
MPSSDSVLEKDLSTRKMPNGIRLLFIVFLLFNFFWIYIYYIANRLTEAQIAAMPEQGRALYLDIPEWVMIAGGIGLVSSVIGLTLVLFGKRTGIWFLLITLIGVLLRDGWFIYDGRVWELIPKQSLILSSISVVIFIMQFLIALYASNKKWLK